MSRWLATYSPPATLIRLTALSITLSYTATQLFRLTGALVPAPTLANLSRCLPIWIMTCVLLLVGYFCMQWDLDVAGNRDRGRDDRRRRLVLRLKCLYSVAGCSLVSLVGLVVVIHVGGASGPAKRAI